LSVSIGNYIVVIIIRHRIHQMFTSTIMVNVMVHNID
jgi:hypothetical protein